jgi:hypothetical protein
VFFASDRIMFTGPPHRTSLSRRDFLVNASGTAAATFASPAVGANMQAQHPRDSANRAPSDLGQANKVQLSQIHGPSEKDEQAPGPFLPQHKRIGYAIVGIGRLSINQILPAFGASKYCRPTALVSGDRAKALKIAAQYEIPESSVYDYKTYEQLASNPNVQVIYIVLPNGMHEEYVIRGAKTGETYSLRKTDGELLRRGRAYD